jgi:hypothetical protein
MCLYACICIYSNALIKCSFCMFNIFSPGTDVNCESPPPPPAHRRENIQYSAWDQPIGKQAELGSAWSLAN